MGGEEIKDPHEWETVNFNGDGEITDRMKVDNGYIYRTTNSPHGGMIAIAMVHVPDLIENVVEVHFHNDANQSRRS